tara:strand:+ start:1005 stop:1616 length:612 start_codon:yes stop_codon:yes gene_type:complete
MQSGTVFAEPAEEFVTDISGDVIPNRSEADDMSTSKASGGTDETFTSPPNHVTDSEDIIGDPACTDDDAGAPLVDASQATDDGIELADSPGLQSRASKNKFGSQEDSEATIASPADPLDLSGETNQNILPGDEIRRDDRASSTRDDVPPPSVDHGRRELISTVHSDVSEARTQKPDEERKGLFPRPTRLLPRQPSEISDEDML